MTDAFSQLPHTGVPAGSLPLLTRTFDSAGVTTLRHTVASCLRAEGLDGERLEDFVLAVNELMTNAVRHGGGQGRVRLWRHGRTALCEVSDNGGGFATERLDGRERPAPETAGGWGLWLTRQLSDDMTVHSGPAGTTVRIAAVIDRGTSRRTTTGDPTSNQPDGVEYPRQRYV